MNKFSLVVMTIVIATVSNINLYGQESEDSLQSIHLGNVVVTANHTATLQRLAPAMIQVVGKRLFSSVNAECAADALSYQPGVRIEDDCSNCGYKQARINGLDGHYSQILIDSRPVFSAVSNLYGIEQLPSCMIDQIEVMRGGGSALYGASSVAGTINIITRNPSTNSFEASHTITSIGCGNTFDNNTSLNASLIDDDITRGITVFTNNRYRQGYSHTGDGYTTLPRLNMQTIGTKAFYKPNSNSQLSLTYYFMHDNRRGGNRLHDAPEECNICEQARHNMHNASIAWEWTSRDYKWHVDVYAAIAAINRHSYTGGYGTDEEPDPDAALYYSRTTDLTWMIGTLGRYSFDKLLFLPAKLTVGLEYSNDHLKDIAQGYNFITKQSTHIASAYFQNEWRNDMWSILIGARLDKHNLVSKAIFSPRVNIRYSPSQEFTFRATYGEGFRAPQIFDEEMHIEMAAGNRFKIHLVDGLKEERSRTFTLSANGYHTLGTTHFNWTLEGFYTSLSNVFAERETDIIDEQDCNIIERYNGSGAKVMGITTTLDIMFSRLVDVEMGVTFQRSRYDEAEQWSDDIAPQRRMFRTPNAYGYCNIKVTPFTNFDIDITGTCTGSMLVKHYASSGTPVDVEVKTPTFWDMNTKVSYTFNLTSKIQMNVNAGIMNMFNQFQKDLDPGPERDSAYIYGPSLPRSIFAGVGFKL
ncbi:MAG: TonB-dependent receptor [Muribaculaceae bacterium]|nr:TonB-dependent receptor [Muribaculaceae bacterium]